MRSRVTSVMTLVLPLVMLGMAVLAGPAFAVEEEGGSPAEHGPLPGIDELGSQSEIAREFFPEPYESPSIMPKLIYPLLGIAVVATLAMLLLYLVWQPRFAEERRSGKRRR